MVATGATGDPGERPSRRREAVGVLVLVLVVAAVVWAVARNRESFADTLHRVGVGGIALSVLCGLVGVGATGPQWRTVLGGLGIRFALPDAMRVFFVSQLGKYLPGSVWPVVMQMEAGRDRGASRATVLTGNLVTLVISLASGLVLAGLLLPFSSPEALGRYWWTLAALPLLVVLALPRSLPSLLDRLLVLARRPPLHARMAPRATVSASSWALLAWVGLGLHLTVLAAAVGGFSWALLALCVGGMGLAVSAGVLFLPAPAGAGLREVVLGLVLASVMTSGQAVAVVVASRVVLIIVDVLLAGVGALLGRVARRRTTAA